MGDAGVSLLDGEVRLKAFLLGNPQGFKSAQAVKIDRTDLDSPDVTAALSEGLDQLGLRLKGLR